MGHFRVCCTIFRVGRPDTAVLTSLDYPGVTSPLLHVHASCTGRHGGDGPAANLCFTLARCFCCSSVSRSRPSFRTVSSTDSPGSISPLFHDIMLFLSPLSRRRHLLHHRHQMCWNLIFCDSAISAIAHTSVAPAPMTMTTARPTADCALSCAF